MTGALPWSAPAQSPMTNDSSDVLRRIEQNTASLVQWMKILVVVVGVLVVINLFFL
jgi:hypothetical protein